jgi:hypothetical protein
MQIKYAVGNAANPPFIDGSLNVIAHCVNNVFAWGSGFVLALNQFHPTAKDQYLTHRQATITSKPEDYLGRCLLAYSVVGQRNTCWLIANLFGQHKIWSPMNPTPIKYDALRVALANLRNQLLAVPENRTCVIHMPRIGAGLARGDWSKIEPLIIQELDHPRLSVIVYDLP